MDDKRLVKAIQVSEDKIGSFCEPSRVIEVLPVLRIADQDIIIKGLMGRIAELEECNRVLEDCVELCSRTIELIKSDSKAFGYWWPAPLTQTADKAIITCSALLRKGGE